MNQLIEKQDELIKCLYEFIEANAYGNIKLAQSLKKKGKDIESELATLKQQIGEETKESVGSAEINYKDCLTFVNGWLWDSPDRKSDSFDRDQTNDAAKMVQKYATMKVTEALEKRDHSASTTMRDELIKYDMWLDKKLTGYSSKPEYTEQIVDEYLNSKSEE